jgi:hypothetical protein
VSGPGFWRQAIGAFVLSLVAAIAYHALAPILGGALVLRGVVVGAGAAYLAMLLPSLEARIGRLVVAVAWLAVTLGLFALDPHVGVWLLAESLLVWLVRCVYRYDGLAGAFADAALTALAAGTAVAVAAHTRSVFLATWSCLLVHALFVWIPTRRFGGGGRAGEDPPGDAFEEAHRSAEAALRRMAMR